MKKCLILLCAMIFIGIIIAGCSNGETNERGEVDIDLTALSATLVEAEYQNMLANFDNYAGKTIRAVGTYYTLFMESTGRHYHYVIVVTGDECCQLGFEFKRDGDHTVFDDYPAVNAVIEVIGVLDRYDENGTTYMYIDVTEFILR